MMLYKIKMEFDKSAQMRSEQKSYIVTNLKMLFQQEFSSEQLNSISEQVISNKKANHDSFEQRVLNQISKFRSGNFDVSVKHSNWQPDHINSLKQEYGGALVALFHFGNHRDILVDMVATNIKVVAPIAGRSYYHLKELATEISAEQADKLQLVEVEEEKVSRELIKSLRKGSVGAIYVDGNMGPETPHNSKTKGCVTVKFLNQEINVKTGIARLATLLKLPILPIFSIPQLEQQPIVTFGQPIIFNSKESNSAQAVMQNLYEQLATHVLQTPAQWEYMMCLHRWVKAKDTNTNFVAINDKSVISINEEDLSVIEKNDDTFWINTNKGKGLKIPIHLKHSFTELTTMKRIPAKHFINLLANDEMYAIQLLTQLAHNELIVVH